MYKFETKNSRRGLLTCQEPVRNIILRENTRGFVEVIKAKELGACVYIYIEFKLMY